MIHDPITL